MLKNILLLIDGSSYIYRAYYALPQLTNSLGEATGAIYGTLNMIKRLLLKYHYSYIAIAFDVQKNTSYRKKLFKYYKCNRLPMPNQLGYQINGIYEIIKALGLPIITINNFEADDIIGTLAVDAARNNCKVFISTIDKDFSQLVSPEISIIDGLYKIISQQEILHKFGVMPYQIVDYLALIGDKSDNIPGLFGIGKKTAQILLKKFDNLKEIFLNLDEINNLGIYNSKNIIKKLKKNREIVFLSYQLAKIKTDLKLNFSFNQLKINKPCIKTCKFLFKRYEFKNWINYLKLIL